MHTSCSSALSLVFWLAALGGIGRLARMTQSNSKTSGKFNAEAAKRLSDFGQRGYRSTTPLPRNFVTDFSQPVHGSARRDVWHGDEKYNYSGLTPPAPGQIIPEHWHVKADTREMKFLVRHSP